MCKLEIGRKRKARTSRRASLEPRAQAKKNRASPTDASIEMTSFNKGYQLRIEKTGEEG